MTRGKELERYLDDLCDVLESHGIYTEHKYTRRLTDGTPVQGEPMDFEILAHGRIYKFDAKECSGTRWYLSKATQAEKLKQAKDNGADAFFLVWFKRWNIAVKFDVDLILSCRERGIKSLAHTDGLVWEWERLLEGVA